MGKLSGLAQMACSLEPVKRFELIDIASESDYNTGMPRKTKTTPTASAEYGLTVPEKQCSTDERETITKYSIMCSLVVFKGLSVSAAYRAVYGAPEGSQCPSAIRSSHKFQGMLTRMRAAQGLTDEQVKGCIESLYISLLTDEECPAKQRLQAAAQWQKLRGLEKSKEPQAIDDDELIWRQAMTRKVKVLDAEVEKG